MNNGMTMKWRGGTKSKTMEGMLNVFQSTFSRSGKKQISRICTCKTERTLQISGKCVQFKQSCLWATLSYFCLRKQGRKINAMRRVVFEKCIKKSSALSHVKCEEVSLQLNLLHCRQKPRPLCETGTKRELEKEGNAATG